jgi:hypothetical protein
MRFSEILTERQTKRHPDHDAVSMGATRSRDVGGYDRVYHQHRIMMAMAMADGKSTKAVDSPESSWNEKFNTHHPYTQEEYNMILSAFNTVPTDFDHVSKFGKSVEPAGANTVSPVAKPKKNKYGV